MKKIYAFLIIAMMAFMAACGSNSASNEPASPTNNAETSSATSKEAEPLVFKLSHMAGTEHVLYNLSMVPFTEEVEELTDGRVKFDIYPGGALAAPNEQWEAVVSGIADAAWHIAGYTPNKFPLHSILNLPHVASGTTEQMSEVVYRIYEQFPEVQAEYGEVKPLWFHATDEFAIFSNKPINTFEDVKGLKLRAPNPEGAIAIESWGATPVSLPANDLYDALQKGVVDGSVSSVSQLADFNLYDVVDYVTYGDFVNSIHILPMNKDSWAKISDEDKQILEEQLIGLNMSKVAGRAFDSAAEKAKEKALEAGITFSRLPDEEIEKFKASTKDYVEGYIADLEAKGLPAQQVYDTAKALYEEVKNR